MNVLEPVMTVDELNAFLKNVYPQLGNEFSACRVIDVSPGRCLVRLDADQRHLRPGDTVSGAALFTLTDIGGYACVLSHAGPDALSVTTNLNINFMRKAGPGPLDADCRILKMGRRLMVFEAAIMGDDELIAHATGTYSIPPSADKNAVK